MRVASRVIPSAMRSPVMVRRCEAQATLKAIIFDCDGVILESEELHRRAYNDTFSHFAVQCEGQKGTVEWSEQFYDKLQNKVGGGKPKMRWYFKQHGWPRSAVHSGRVAGTEAEQTKLIDTLQDYKSAKYQELIGSGQVEPRPGVLRVMDEARAAGIKLAVCSAATKSSVVYTLTSLLGQQRFDNLDCFLAGDDVDKKKPDPMIYTQAAAKLGVQPAECVVIEDSVIGLQAAAGAGMRCIITYTSSTAKEAFGGAERIVASLGFPANITVEELQQGRIAQDDRINMSTSDTEVFWHIPNQ